MRGLPTAAITQKNKLSTSGAWLVLVTAAYPTLASPSYLVRYVNNTKDVVFGGSTYSKRSFSVQQVTETIKGELPRATLTIFDPALDWKDTLQDNLGWSGGEVQVQLVYFNTSLVATSTGILQYFTILDSAWDDANAAVRFNISVNAPMQKRFPRDRYVAAVCRHVFKGGFCRYAEDTDDGTIVSSLIAFYHVAGGLDYIRLAPYAAYERFTAGQQISVTGSVQNLGRFEISTVVFDTPTGFTRFYLTSDYTLTNENSAHSLTITITAICNHTLDNCRANNNSHMYGASPGVAGGLYGG